jgi:hypothetical protein
VITRIIIIIIIIGLLPRGFFFFPKPVQVGFLAETVAQRHLHSLIYSFIHSSAVHNFWHLTHLVNKCAFNLNEFSYLTYNYWGPSQRSQCIATRATGWSFGTRTGMRPRTFLFSTTVQTGPGTHRTFRSVGTGTLSRG